MIQICSAVEFERLCRDFIGKADRLSFQVKGGSMYPFIRSGDSVDLQLLGGANNLINKGDIVLFSKDGSMYLHRVLRRKPEGFLVKGDMSLGVDGIIGRQDVLARVIAVSGGSRRLNLSSPANRVLAVAAAEASVVWQYPVLAAGKASQLFLAAFSRVQGWRACRTAAKIFFPAAVSIRQAVPQDEEQLRDLYLMAGYDLRQGIARLAGKGFWLVAEEKEKIVGGLTISPCEDSPAVWMIFGLEVKPLYRGRGIGRSLVRAALKKAQESGAQEVSLFVNKASRAAVRLYGDLGFVQGQAVPAGFSRSADELFLSYRVPAGPEVHSRLLFLLSRDAGSRAGWAAAAAREGIFYPLYLHAAPCGSVSREVFYEHLSKSAAFSAQVSAVLQRLESLRIPLILFKGPAIDRLIYDDFLRPRLDLDIAVHDEHQQELEQALVSWGYATPADEKAYLLPEYSNSRLFLPGPAGDLPAIHVHRHIINNMFLSADGNLGLRMERVWEETVLFGGYSFIRTLRPEMNIVFLCEHALKHDFDQLVYLYEIERLIEGYGRGFDWERMVALAVESGLARQVYHGLFLAQEICAAAVSSRILAALEPGTVSAKEKQFIAAVRAMKRRRYGSYPVYLAMRRGWVRKGRFILRTLFPPGFGVKSFLVRLYRWARSSYAG